MEQSTIFADFNLQTVIDDSQSIELGEYWKRRDCNELCSTKRCFQDEQPNCVDGQHCLSPFEYEEECSRCFSDHDCNVQCDVPNDCWGRRDCNNDSHQNCKKCFGKICGEDPICQGEVLFLPRKVLCQE